MREFQYDLGFIGVADDIDPEVVAYCQVGIQKNQKFTGFVLRSVGGGNFQMFYYLEGKPLPSKYDDDENQATIERGYPNLIEEAYKMMYKYVYFEDLGIPLFKKIPQTTYIKRGAQILPIKEHFWMTGSKIKVKKGIEEKPRNLIEAINFGMDITKMSDIFCMN